MDRILKQLSALNAQWDRVLAKGNSGQLLTPRQAARRLGKTNATLARMVRRGEILLVYVAQGAFVPDSEVARIAMLEEDAQLSPRPIAHQETFRTNATRPNRPKSQ